MSLQLESSLYRHKSGKYEKFPPKIFPIYFDGGTNCVHIGTREGGIVVDTDDGTGEDYTAAYIGTPESSVREASLETGNRMSPSPAVTPIGSTSSGADYSPGVKPSGSLQHLAPVEHAIRTTRRKRRLEDDDEGERAETPMRHWIRRMMRS